ncbi:hypothetical protein J2857_000491 [Neorhizobium galegae]|nr:hypothetical protein [Neorhizobium galegae]MBP2557740.1 hypothetical protein [Neorhizobium galegae]
MKLEGHDRPVEGDGGAQSFQDPQLEPFDIDLDEIDSGYSEPLDELVGVENRQAEDTAMPRWAVILHKAAGAQVTFEIFAEHERVVAIAESRLMQPDVIEPVRANVIGQPPEDFGVRLEAMDLGEVPTEVNGVVADIRPDIERDGARLEAALQEFQKPSFKPAIDKDGFVDALCGIQFEDVSPVGAVDEDVALSRKLPAPQRLDYGAADGLSHNVHRIRQYVAYLHVGAWALQPTGLGTTTSASCRLRQGLYARQAS